MKSKLFGHSANDLFWFILPLVLPSLLARYELSYSQAGGVLTIYLLFTALGSFITGKLSDQVSRKKILAYGLLLAAAGLTAAGFAPNLPVFLVFISITAAGVSTFHPVMYAVIDESYPENKSGVMGLYECFGTSAILLMYLVNGFLLGRVGVRGVLMVTSLPAVVMGLIYLFTDSIKAPVSVDGPDTGSSGNVGAEGNRRRFILFIISVILRVISVTALLNFLPTIFVKFFGMAEGPAAYATAFYFAGGIGGSIIAGRLSNRFNSFAIIIGGTIFIGFTMLILAGNLPAVLYLIIVALFGASASGCIINQNLLMRKLGGTLGTGEIFGILMGTMTVASAFSPALFGIILDLTNYRHALMLFSMPLIVSVIILAWLLKTDKSVETSLESSL